VRDAPQWQPRETRATPPKATLHSVSNSILSFVNPAGKEWDASAILPLRLSPSQQRR